MVEPVERHGGNCSIAFQGLDESDEGMTLRDLLRARSTDDEDRRHMPRADHETDQLDGLSVAPLKIVEDQQARPVAGYDGSACRIEQPVALSQVARLALARLRGGGRSGGPGG